MKLVGGESERKNTVRDKTINISHWVKISPNLWCHASRRRLFVHSLTVGEDLPIFSVVFENEKYRCRMLTCFFLVLRPRRRLRPHSMPWHRRKEEKKKRRSRWRWRAHAVKWRWKSEKVKSADLCDSFSLAEIATVCAIVFFLLFFSFGHRVHDMLALAPACLAPTEHKFVAISCDHYFTCWWVWVRRFCGLGGLHPRQQRWLSWSSNHTFFTWSWIISFNQFHAQRLVGAASGFCQFCESMMTVDTLWISLELDDLMDDRVLRFWMVEAHIISHWIWRRRRWKFSSFFHPAWFHLVEREITSLSFELRVQPRCVIC